MTTIAWFHPFSGIAGDMALGAGRVGVCHFHVDAATGRFTPQHGAVSP